MMSAIAIQEYILSEMLRLCSSSPSDEDIYPDAAAVAPLFDIHARFAEVSAVLGTPVESMPSGTGAPESLRNSIEHHFRFARWPEYDFVICASPSGYAWGQRFIRSRGSLPPPITQVSDLRRWSHTFAEVAATLGAPVDVEGWSTWETATFRLHDRSVRLCFVFGLLQSVASVGSASA
jgi:hypothetical protein